jgi:hypothetical protein
MTKVEDSLLKPYKYLGKLRWRRGWSGIKNVGVKKSWCWEGKYPNLWSLFHLDSFSSIESLRASDEVWLRLHAAEEPPFDHAVALMVAQHEGEWGMNNAKYC